MDLNLKDRVVVVTGANSGIGLGIVEAFLAEGSRVVGGDLEADELESRAETKDVHPVKVDLATPNGGETLIRAAIDRYGGVDVLVNNVGIGPYREGFLSVGDADWARVLDLNFMSMVRTSRAVLPHMVERGRGSIISIASEVARQPDIFFVDYCVSKAAIVMLSKTLANEFGPKGIRANTVSPGPTLTPLWTRPGGFAESLAETYGFDSIDDAIDHFAKNVRSIPTGRLGEPADVAAAVLFLASDVAKQVTGSDYAVNGGIVKGV